MNRTVCCLFLALAVTLATSTAAQQKKTIKDRAEYNAYMAAFNTQDPSAKAAAMEGFLGQYPNSVIKMDALEQAMASYQQTGNQDKVMEKARQILALEPDHIRALAILTAIYRAELTSPGPSQRLDAVAACDYAQTGLQKLPGWQRPAGMTDADFTTLTNQMADIFNGAAGYCALRAKNYTNARGYYEKAIQIDPANLQDVYQLSVADLEMNPIEVKGFWYCGKGINLAQRQNNVQAVQSMVSYCKGKYKAYHGAEDGWDQIVASSAGESAPPSSFRVKARPTPCELAVQAVQENDPGQLSFADWEFILARANCSPANKAAADKVWRAIQQMEKYGEARLLIPVKVISATSSTIEAAISEENQQSNTADLHVELEKPLARPPAPASTIKITGVITKYTPDPFIFTMEKGALQR